MAFIEIKKVTKNYPIGGNFFTALHEVSLEFNKGEFTGIIGPSGSGKTTLLNIIGALDVPSFGSATVLDCKIETLSHMESAKLRNQHMGFIFQTYNLLPVYTVYENVEFPLLLQNFSDNQRRDKVLSALNHVGILDKKDSRPFQLSGGEAQRTAIARAIVKKPKLILADEPTANLDMDNSYNILDIMRKLNQELDTTFIFATHDEKVIKYLSRKVHLLDGRVSDDEQVVSS
ncbi:ABC transporter ATP-binding protein [bacterium]